MVQTAYTTAEDVEQYLTLAIDPSFNNTVESYIAAMSAYADQIAGYPIYRDPETEGAETTRLYDGNSLRTLTIDPVHTISAVTLSDVEITPTKAPYNSDTKTELRLPLNVFSCGTANVSVTGIHCLKKTLPEQLKWAVTVLVAGIVQQVNEQRDGVKSEKIGDYSVSYGDETARADILRAKEIIQSYRPLVF